MAVARRGTGLLAVAATLALVGAPTAGAGAAPVEVTRVALAVPGGALGEGITLGAARGRLVVGVHGTTSCRLVTVATDHLLVRSSAPVACVDPRLEGRSAAPVEVVARGASIGEVRIARRSASGVVRLGPVVLRYPNISDGRPEWVYGGGSLWVYDAGSTDAGGKETVPAEAVRVSLRTGAVVQRVAMPMLTRIVLAADRDGLWFGPSVTSGWRPHHPPALVSFVALHARRPTVLRRHPEAEGGGHLDWIVASGHHAWVAAATGRVPGSVTTLTYASPRSAPRVVRAPATTAGPSDIGEGSFDTAPVLALRGVGLVALEPGWLGTVGTRGALAERVVRLDPRTGRSAVVAQVATRPRGALVADMVAGGALYLAVAGTGTTVELYRIALSGSGTAPSGGR